MKELLTKLFENSATSKDAHVQHQKILRYINTLECSDSVTLIGEPKVKHITLELWELRPTPYRIFFFCHKDNKIVLLHYFIKKTQKTPPNEITRALNYIYDYQNRNQ
ncbi:MAG: type II toxin-antitoxin system RelE/ParE family toxin [Deltaproteobacteria bacterium]|nr:type II toxin-antitoxin system RelE/ParE family toxin [Deltaproteobacteria bacterium]